MPSNGITDQSTIYPNSIETYQEISYEEGEPASQSNYSTNKIVLVATALFLVLGAISFGTGFLTLMFAEATFGLYGAIALGSAIEVLGCIGWALLLARMINSLENKKVEFLEDNQGLSSIQYDSTTADFQDDDDSQILPPPSHHKDQNNALKKESQASRRLDFSGITSEDGSSYGDLAILKTPKPDHTPGSPCLSEDENEDEFSDFENGEFKSPDATHLLSTPKTTLHNIANPFSPATRQAVDAELIASSKQLLTVKQACLPKLQKAFENAQEEYLTAKTTYKTARRQHQVHHDELLSMKRAAMALTVKSPDKETTQDEIDAMHAELIAAKPEKEKNVAILKKQLDKATESWNAALDKRNEAKRDLESTQRVISRNTKELQRLGAFPLQK